MINGILSQQSRNAFKKKSLKSKLSEEQFYLKNLFTNELERCKEKEFDEIVTKHRSCYELVYDGANAQNFVADGEIEARRERW